MIDTILVFLSALPALYGTYLIGEFLVLRLMGDIHEAEITGFLKIKNKGRFLPEVKIEEQIFPVQKIDQLSYMITPPISQQRIPVVSLKNGHRRVFGYGGLLAGILCVLPFFFVLALRMEKDLMVAQVTYILLFIGVSVGGWVLLKIIPKGY